MCSMPFPEARFTGEVRFLVGQLGQTVARSDVTVVDDALMPAGLGSSPFDDEGVPTRETRIIEDGVLRNYLHSAYTARKLGSNRLVMEVVQQREQ
jgi:predicted Zn-dependent protease